MNRIQRKTIATIVTASILLSGVSPGHIVWADENNPLPEVEYIYDDVSVDNNWRNNGKQKNVAFMQGGAFDEVVDENAILTLVDEDGNKITIPSVNESGEEIFSKVTRSVSGDTYDFVKLQNEDGTALMRFDGTYFGDGAYYDADLIQPVTDGVIRVGYAVGEDEYGDLIYSYELVTESGKTIKFDGYEQSGIGVKKMGDYLICYCDDAEEICAYHIIKDETQKLKGKLEYGIFNDILIVSTGEQKIIYDKNLKQMGEFSSNTYFYQGIDGSVTITYEDYSEDIMDLDGSFWNNTGKMLSSIMVIDSNKGYFWGREMKTDCEYIMSRDNNVDINIYEMIQNARIENELDESSYIKGSMDVVNGDYKIVTKELTDSSKETTYLFLQKDNYETMIELENTNRIYSISDCVLTANYYWSSTESAYSNIKMYNSQYEPIEIQMSQEMKDNISSITDYTGNGKFFWIRCEINGESFDYALNKDGSITDYIPMYEVTDANFWYNQDLVNSTIQIYNRERELIYTGSYADDGSYAWNRNSTDGSLCMIANEGGKGKYTLLGYDGTIYFGMDDYSVEYDNFLVTKDGGFRTVVYKTDEEGNKKYGLLYLDNIKKKLTSEDNISMEYVSGQLERDVSLQTRIIPEGDEEYADIDIKDINADATEVNTTLCEITLTDVAQEEIQPAGTVKVKIPCMTEYDGTKCKVYLVLENGKLADVNAVHEDGFLCFETSAVGKFLVAELQTPLKVKGTVNASTIQSGDKVTITAAATGGEGKYVYSYLVYNKTTDTWARLTSSFTSSKTFTWTAGSAGERKFYVEVQDNEGTIVRSSAMNVEVANMPLTINSQVSSSSVEVGQKVTVTGVATGGDGSYKYSYLVHNRATGVWARLTPSFISNKAFNWTAGSTGTRDFYVEVKDGEGMVVRSKAATVTVTEPPLAITGSASAATVKTGDKVTITGTASGGTGDYTYSYLVYNRTTGTWARLTSSFTDNKTFTWTAGSAGTRDFYVEVKDSTGKVVRSKAVTVLVSKPELAITSKASAAAVTTGTKVTITGTVSGGTGDYTYSYLVYNKTTGVWARLTSNFIKNNTFTWTAGSAGTRAFYVEVKDGTGKIVRSSAVNILVK